MSRALIRAAMRQAHRRDLEDKAARIHEVLRSDKLGRFATVEEAYAAIVSDHVAIVRL